MLVLLQIFKKKRMGLQLEKAIFRRSELKYCWVPIWRADEVEKILNEEKAKRLQEIADRAIKELNK